MKIFVCWRKLQGYSLVTSYVVKTILLQALMKELFHLMEYFVPYAYKKILEILQHFKIN